MIRTVLTALLATAGLAFGGTASAVEPTALSCYGGAVNLTYTYSSTPVEYGPYTTTSRCTDINMRLTTNNGTYLAACVVFIDHTTACNRGNSYSIIGPPWATPATDVKDGTRFKLRVRPYDADSRYLNFQLAF